MTASHHLVWPELPEGRPPERFLQADGHKNIGFPVSLSHIFFFPAALLPLRPGPCCSRKSSGFSGPGPGPSLSHGLGLRIHQAAVLLTWGNVIRNITASPKGRTVEQRGAASAIRERLPDSPVSPRLGLIPPSRVLGCSRREGWRLS